MARPLRIEFPGALYHITSRGDGREDIYLSDTDRQLFLSVLAQVCEHNNWVCHAFCLMTNHYHLLIETPEANLASGMRYLNGVYTQRFNCQHERVGHVFQGRYKSILVQKSSYLLELARYIVLNPVRACMTNSAEDYLWSSFRATAGLAPTPEFLHVDFLLSQFSNQRQQAIVRYRQFVAVGNSKRAPWAQLKGQIYLGDQEFIEEMQSHVDNTQNLEEIPSVQRRSPPLTIEEYERHGASRNEAIVSAYQSGAYTLHDIADHFHLHYSTISRVVKRAVQNSRPDPI